MIKSAYLLGAALLLSGYPAFAQQAGSSAQAVTSSDDDDFMVGLRRVGVLAGQSVICTPEATRPQEINKVANAGNMIAMEFGLRAAFNFVGAAGYGSGNSFDKETCSDVLKEWATVQQKYGEK